MAETIKSDDACARCYWGVENPGCRGARNCEECERSIDSVYCKCSQIKYGTPCPYFKEAVDE